MSDLDFTYQDGLRLSELYGQLSGLEYSLDHLFMSVLPYIGLFSFLVAMAWIFVFGFELGNLIEGRLDRIWDKRHDWNKYTSWRNPAPVELQEARREHQDYTNRIRTAMFWTGLALIIILVITFTTYGFEYHLTRCIIETQAQIDALESRLN